MITASAQSDSDREGKDEDGIRRLECPDGPQRRLMSLTKSQSSDVERDADRDMAICQGYQDVEEVGNGDVTVVDGKFFAGTGLMSRGTETEGQGLEEGQLNAANFVPTDQLNTWSLESVVVQRPEGQVLADMCQSDGQVLEGEHLNAADLRPTSRLNSVSLGHFVGQRPGGQAPANEQSDPSR